MSKKKLLFSLGIAIALLPFLGIPTSFKKFLILAAGIGVAYIAHSVGRTKNSEESSDLIQTFIENSQTIETPEEKIQETITVTEIKAMPERLRKPRIKKVAVYSEPTEATFMNDPEFQEALATSVSDDSEN